jgi:hypothetical protein
MKEGALGVRDYNTMSEGLNWLLLTLMMRGTMS